MMIKAIEFYLEKRTNEIHKCKFLTVQTKKGCIYCDRPTNTILYEFDEMPVYEPVCHQDRVYSHIDKYSFFRHLDLGPDMEPEEMQLLDPNKEEIKELLNLGIFPIKKEETYEEKWEREFDKEIISLESINDN